jgi:23S rRNA (cytosine1962-C5)-methyltransferase
VTIQPTPDAPARARVFRPAAFADHALFDSGGGEKLERFGPVVLRRPDPQALWSQRRSAAEWRRADLAFVRESDRGGRWEARRGAHGSALGPRPEWIVRFASSRFIVRPTPFKHVGVFPEQSSNWALVAEAAPQFGASRPRLLNLFGYTGVGSVLAAKSGFDVTHVDASKAALAWTRENLAASELAPDAVRIVLDDALAFARREVRRGELYECVLMDPPHYGRGPKGETWQFEEHIAPLIETVKSLLRPRSLVILSTYAIGCSPLALENLVRELGPGDVTAGELALGEVEEDDASRASRTVSSRPPRQLPAGFCARWARGLALDTSA